MISENFQIRMKGKCIRFYKRRIWKVKKVERLKMKKLGEIVISVREFIRQWKFLKSGLFTGKGFFF